MNVPLTVCFVIVGLDYAGAEMQLFEVIGRLRARGWRIFVVSLLTPAAFVRELGDLGIRVISLDAQYGEPVRPSTVIRFLREVRAIRPDIIHGHMIHSNLLARVARLVTPARAVFATVHSIDEGARARMWLYRLTEPLGTLTTSVSEAGRDRHLAVGASSADRIVVLPNGIDTERFRPDPEARRSVRDALGVPPDRFVWVTVARFSPPKDHVTLLRAFERLLAPAELWLVGQGQLQADVQALVTELGLQSRVRFLGVRKDVPALLAAADALVLSSRHEAMPISLLEAAACGLPCVSSDVGAAATIILDGRTGFVARPKDITALAQAMDRVQTLSAAERLELGNAGRARVVDRWGLEGVVDRWEELYREHAAHPWRPLRAVLTPRRLAGQRRNG